MAGKKSALYGGVVDQRTGDGQPVLIDRVGFKDRAGYAPERLDPVIEKLVRLTEAGAELLESNTPMLIALMQRLQQEVATLLVLIPPTAQAIATEGEAAVPKISGGLDIALNLATKISAILERLNKMTMQSVKAKDDATRLRTFLATGDDEDRDGLKGLSENQLRRIVSEAAQGWTPQKQIEDKAS